MPGQITTKEEDEMEERASPDWMCKKEEEEHWSSDEEEVSDFEAPLSDPPSDDEDDEEESDESEKDEDEEEEDGFVPVVDTTKTDSRKGQRTTPRRRHTFTRKSQDTDTIDQDDQDGSEGEQVKQRNKDNSPSRHPDKRPRKMLAALTATPQQTPEYNDPNYEEPPEYQLISNLIKRIIHERFLKKVPDSHISKLPKKLPVDGSYYLVPCEGNRINCLLPFCQTKNWSHFEGLKYHGKSCEHDILALCNWYDELRKTEVANASDALADEGQPVTPQVKEWLEKVPFYLFPIVLEEFTALSISKNSLKSFRMVLVFSKTRPEGHQKPTVRTPRTDNPPRSGNLCVQISSEMVYSGYSRSTKNTWQNAHFLPRPQYNHFLEMERTPFLAVPIAHFPVNQEPLKVCFNFSKSRGNIERQGTTFTDVQLFSGINVLDDDKSKKRGYVLNAGGSVWGLDWCPGNPEYLAIGTYSDNLDEHHAFGQRMSPEVDGEDAMKGFIQVWNVVPDNNAIDTPPRLALLIMHDFGCVYDVKWCPTPVICESTRSQLLSDSTLELSTRHLGLLAATFGDGTMRIFMVPRPETLSIDADGHVPVIKLLNPVLIASLPSSMLWKINWGPDLKIAGASTDGHLCCYDVLPNLLSHSIISNATVISKPHIYTLVHDSCIFSVDWWRGDEPCTLVDYSSYLISTGSDGKIFLTDIREPNCPSLLVKTSGFSCSSSWITNENGAKAIYTDGLDNSVRVIPFEKQERAISDGFSNGIGGFVPFIEDRKKEGTSGACIHNSHIWSTSVSPFMPFVASCGADGSVKVSNLNRLWNRANKPVQLTPVQLEFMEEARSFCFHENVPSLTLSMNNRVGRGSIFSTFFPPEVSLQKVAWNRDVSSFSWLACGGVMGLVRVLSCSECS